jgi:hypothetical protein
MGQVVIGNLVAENATAKPKKLVEDRHLTIG